MSKEPISVKSLVSIIIPVFNVRPYLEECLDSVINQTYRNLEILVIDDGSNDSSGDVCDKYATKDPRIIAIHQDNCGLSAARNTGLDQITGDVVAFLDSDDAYQPAMIQTALEALDDNCADIVVCGFSIHDTQARMEVKSDRINNRIKKDNEIIDREEALKRVYSGRINAAPWNKLYKKEIWDGLRFPKGHIFEGTYMVLDLFDRAKRVVLVNRALIMHRNRPESVSNTYTMKHAQDSMYVHDHYEAFVRDHSPEVFSEKQVQTAIKGRIRRAEGAFYHYAFCHPDEKKRCRQSVEC